VNALAAGCRAALNALAGYTGNQTFAWTLPDGTSRSVACVPNDEREANSPIVGGFDNTGGLSLFVQFEDWLTADSTLVTVDSTLYTVDQGGQRKPVVGRRVTYQGKTLKILSCTISAAQSHYVLSLGSNNR